MTSTDTVARAFVQVLAAAAGGGWIEIVRAGWLPPALAAQPGTTQGPLDLLLGWMRADDLPLVRDAMQAVRLGAPIRDVRVRFVDPVEGVSDSDARIEISGGEGRAGLWAYVLRVEAETRAAEVPTPVELTAAIDAGPSQDVGVVEYEHPSVNVRLDAVARRLHGLPDSIEFDIPVIEWAACFDGEDQIGAISGLCWPVATELPRRLSLRLAGAAPGTGGRLELVVQLASRRGSVRALCRGVPGG